LRVERIKFGGAGEFGIGEVRRVDRALEERLDTLLESVTTISPNNLDDWREIQVDVLDRVRDEGFTATVDELVVFFRSRGMEQPFIPALRWRLKRTFGGDR
jgi:hypothetical protein